MNLHRISPVILRCERSEPRRMHGRTVALQGPRSRGHLRTTSSVTRS